MKKLKQMAAAVVCGALVFTAVTAFADVPQQTIVDRPHYSGEENPTKPAEEAVPTPPVEQRTQPGRPVEQPATQPDAPPAQPAEQFIQPVEQSTQTQEHHEQPVEQPPETAEHHEEYHEQAVEEREEYHWQAEEQATEPEVPPAIPNFLSFKGTVVDIKPVLGNDGQPARNQQYIRVQNEELGTTIFRTDDNTFMLGEAVKVGDEITGWYASDMPLTLIYPPQILAQVIVNGEFENVKIDRFYFDSERGALVSASNKLVLNFTLQTPILTHDGQEFYVPPGAALLNELSGRALVVTYFLTDRAMPASTMPSDSTMTITVLPEEMCSLPEESHYDYYEDYHAESHTQQEPEKSSSTMGEISVNNVMLEAIWLLIDDTPYLPFRATVDALGFGDTIKWDGDNYIVTVSNGKDNIVFPIDAKSFIIGDNIKTLQNPAILKNSTTYVPWQFFKDVFGVNARLDEGKVIVDAENVTQ